MKHVIFAPNGVNNAFNVLSEGEVAICTLSSPNTSVSDTVKEDFKIVLGRGDDTMPFVIDEVDYNSLRVGVTKAQSGDKYNVKLAASNDGHISANDEVRINVIKKGKHFNEHSVYNFTYKSAKDENPSACLYSFIDWLTLIKDELNISINSDTAGYSIVGNGYDDYEIQLYNLENRLSKTSEKHAITPTLDVDYIKNLLQNSAAGKGFVYLEGDGKDIYPGYPEAVPSNNYIMYTLRFAVPRASAKTRDEVVNQVVHIITLDSDEQTLNKIFGLSDNSNVTS